MMIDVPLKSNVQKASEVATSDAFYSGLKI